MSTMYSRLTTKTRANVALLTDQRYTASAAAPGDWYFGNILRDDELLQDALAALGLSSVRINWACPDVDWSMFHCAVFRTTWDYYVRISEFTTWLKHIEPQTRLCNDASLIRWNLDKHYLSDLESQDIPVVPSRFIEAGSTIYLHELLNENGWKEAVLKPCISGGARHTYRINRENAGLVQSTVQSLITGESFLVQPFIEDVLFSGEVTLMIIDGCFTHAVRKMPKAGDFRVQDDHGGTIHPYEPSQEQIDLAERVMTACPLTPVYGRVDLVWGKDECWRVMELEIIEPELWLRKKPAAADRFARAIATYATYETG